MKQLGIAAATLGAGFLGGVPDATVYSKTRQASFAPPGWAYGPAWTVAQLADAGSTTRLLAAPASPERTAALRAVAVDTVLYAAFPLLYFRLKSPSLGAVTTVLSAASTVHRIRTARRVDRGAALGPVPQLAWLAVATPVAVVQALANPDPVLRTGALLPRLGRRAHPL